MNFISHKYSKYYNDEKKLEKIKNNELTKYKFRCDKCDHKFMISPYEINVLEKWCHYCENRILCENDCKDCDKKRFSNHVNIKYWDYNRNHINPKYVNIHTNNLYFFLCEKEKHSSQQLLQEIINYDNNCRKCKRWYITW